MKRATLREAASAVVCYAVLAVCLFAEVLAYGANTPTFVTPSMLDRRNGLTDAQYEALWTMGKRPQISQAAARDWMFRASRYANFTNWLNEAGRSNDFARLSFDFQNRALNAETVTNSLTRLNAALANRCEIFSNAVIVAVAQTQDAEARATAHSNRLAKVTDFITAKRDAAKLATTKAIYQAILDKLAEASQ